MHLWEIKAFGDLNLKEFHDLIALRISVFVIEQNCPYQELDGKDQHSIHVIGKKDGDIVVSIINSALKYPDYSKFGLIIYDEVHMYFFRVIYLSFFLIKKLSFYV